MMSQAASLIPGPQIFTNIHVRVHTHTAGEGVDDAALYLQQLYAAQLGRTQECMRALLEVGDASVAAHFLPIMRQVRACVYYVYMCVWISSTCPRHAQRPATIHPGNLTHPPQTQQTTQHIPPSHHPPSLTNTQKTGPADPLRRHRPLAPPRPQQRRREWEWE